MVSLIWYRKPEATPVNLAKLGGGVVHKLSACAWAVW